MPDSDPNPAPAPPPAATSQPQPPITILAFVKRLPSLSQPAFYHHWEHIHAPLVAPWAVKHGFVSYSQVHTPSEIQSPEFQASPLSAYDGYAIFTVAEWGVFEGAFGDGYYGEVIRPDEGRFVERMEVVRVVGVRKGVVEGGRSLLGGGGE